MFRMAVGDVFSIRGRGVVASGMIEEGTVRVGDHVNVNWLSARVDGIEMSRNVAEQAEAGDRVGLLLGGLDKGQIKRGDNISA